VREFVFQPVALTGSKTEAGFSWKRRQYMPRASDVKQLEASRRSIPDFVTEPSSGSKSSFSPWSRNLVKTLKTSFLDQVIDSVEEINVTNMTHLPYVT
jgi:hypothetical protein